MRKPWVPDRSGGRGSFYTADAQGYDTVLAQGGMELSQGERQLLTIAHRLTSIKGSDLIILLENGRITEQGNHEELMALNGKYASMYRTQTGG